MIEAKNLAQTGSWRLFVARAGRALALAELVRRVAEDFARMRTVVVVEYDPAWPAVFQMLRSRVWSVVGDFALSVEHVGSTAVAGLAAKPIIDMSVVLSSNRHVPLAIQRLVTLGYGHQGDLGVEGREAFRAPEGLPAHNLYVCPQGSLGLENQLAVRDYLRCHPETAQAYAALKKRLAREFPQDIDSFVEGKTSFVLSVLREAGLSPDRLRRIELANRRNHPGTK